MRTDYNPFSKDFDDVSADDLSILSSVAEGWYVEYKREVPNAGAVAKSITAFANTYGGWVFYGVTEKSKDDAVAGAFPGIAKDEADAVLQRTRQSVANHCQPSPYFRSKALFGPVETIGLAEDRCVIMIQVPWGPEAPYIHKDGRIYRRVGDGSEPKSENDRFILDQLWSRSSKITQGYADWIGRELETSEAEENSAYARLFLIADFWRDHDTINAVSLQKVREIMSDGNGSYAIPFDNIYQTSGGFICRQTADNDPEMLGLTWKLGHNFHSEIVIPLSKFRSNSLDDLEPWLNGYHHKDRFLKICKEQRYKNPTVVDLNLLLHALLGLTRIQVALAKEFGWKDSIFAKIEISGVWRTIPFFDAPHVLDEYERHGIALGQRNKVLLHPGKEQGSFIELSGPEDNDDSERDRVIMATSLFVNIAIAMGVPLGIDPDGDGSDVKDSIGDFLNAGVRTIEVQKNRSRLS
ncbi:helix-turn-helix domain-containing protein [Mesorhizobium sp. BH1-1-4]|uniref:AlbA family DNA-binding domain-containing protein n=1 Tax=Mesorhizobium sp. BH1-1-4 TaxID=2876662 RepID=UPI001CD0566B|nr:ATP-binding protein [Mesorhizobium sp. BH1-1-4]MBZ9996587.1 ATP-binding protein [Mesorhizobium sp. BH1-1-4]